MRRAKPKELKNRIDKLLVERALAPSRERAQALILAGKVLVDGQKVEKAGIAVPDDCQIRILGEDLRYVSRGGLKLERALDHWQIEVAGRVAVDIGASTGGFTDCLLQNQALQVIAVDTGYGQIDMKLRNDSRVTLLERTNARYLEPGQIARLAVAPISLLVMDVSFISATLVLPAVLGSTKTPAVSSATAEKGLSLEAVVLIKPQFEVGREHVGKGGIVRSEAARQMAIDKVLQAVRNLGAHEADWIDSPILGAEGNKEYLLHARFERE